MTNIRTQAQLTRLCELAGFRPADARVMGAIGMCEAPYTKGGVSYSDNDLVGDQALANNVWGYSYGFFQVRSKRADKGTGRYRDELRLIDPEFQCRAAFDVWKAQGFAAWSTYNSGMHKAYLQDLYPPPAGTHIVRAGDTLTKIAQTVGDGVSWQDLARVNGIRSPYTIFIGQAILYPWVTYTVKQGDTLGQLVDQYGMGVTVAQVAEFNKITNPNQIKVGQMIKIPRSSFFGG